MANLPLQPFKYDELKSNITFGELQKMSFEDVSNWVDEMRVELLKKWDSGIPPSIGMDKETDIAVLKIEDKYTLKLDTHQIKHSQNSLFTTVVIFLLGT